ncbi:MAG: TrkH family potassium uptake protein [Proteobacteria bacterium]|nr:TrkH family potassium uptake protein [Pseudomonadota bacterium]
MRTPLGLGRRYRAILSYTGLILLLAGLWMLTPLALLLAWPEEAGQALAFVLPALALGGIGLLLWRTLRCPDVALTVQEGSVIVVLAWVVVCLASARPFMTAQGLDFTQAVFEAVSGWTTTGLSVVDVTRASHLVLFWRSAMQLAGGAGLAILMLAALTGPPGSGLSVAEGRSEQLVPHVRQSAKLVVLLYAGYTLLGVVALWLAGMNLFDAVNHAYAAVSTGGFSTVPESIGHWDSLGIEAVTLALMVLGNLNFLTVWVLLHGKARAVWRNGEVRVQTVLLPIATVAVFALVCQGLYPTLGKQVRVAVFETVSALTTTGFSTVGYGNWTGFGILLLMVLMLVGGGTCSTAGGIKQYRVYLLFESLAWEFRRPFLPQRAMIQPPYWQGERRGFLADAQVRQMAAFVTLYLFAFVLGTGVLVACGYGLRESLFEFASALGTVGLSVGVTTPDAPRLVLWAETLGMLLGRLEFFVIFVGAAKLLRDVPRLALVPGAPRSVEAP